MSEQKEDQILNKLDAIMEKLEDLTKKVEGLQGAGIAASSPTSSAGMGVGSKKPSDIVMEQKQQKSDNVPGERIKCPECGAVGNNIGKKEDKGNVITYIGGSPQYGTKYYCKKCMHEWV